MKTFLIIIIILFILYKIGFLRLNMNFSFKINKKFLGIILFITSIYLLIQGKNIIGILLLLLTARLLWLPLGILNFFIKTEKNKENISGILTNYISIKRTFINKSRNMKIKNGTFSGKLLYSLSKEEQLNLAQELIEKDPISLLLLANELDSLLPGWVENVKLNMASGNGSTSSSSEMSKEVAYEILGLKPGASEDSIRFAHRERIIRYHPDRGGSDVLASLVNRAKDIALSSQ